MEFFRGKREKSVLNRGGADIKWNSPLLLMDVVAPKGAVCHFRF